jgi:hypothetical protein
MLVVDNVDGAGLLVVLIVYMHGAAFRVRVISFLRPTPAFVFALRFR